MQTLKIFQRCKHKSVVIQTKLYFWMQTQFAFKRFKTATLLPRSTILYNFLLLLLFFYTITNKRAQQQF